MSIKAKLYLSYITLNILVIIVGVVALFAFARTRNQVETTRHDIQYVSDQLVPVSNYFANIATDVTEASLRYYSYSYNVFDEDFAKGDASLAAADKEIGSIDALLATLPRDQLVKTRGVVPEIKSLVTDMRQGSGKLKTAMQDIDGIREKVELRIGKMDAILNALMEEIVGDTVNGYKEADGSGEIPPVMQRRFDRVFFVDELVDDINRGQMLFWRAQSNFGDDAAKIFDESVKVMVDTAKKARDYANSPAVGRRIETKQAFLGLGDEIDGYTAAIAEFDQAWRDSDSITSAITLTSSNLLKRTNDMSDALAAAVADQVRGIETETSTLSGLVSRISTLSWILVILSVVVGVILALFMTRAITLPIIRAIQRLSEAESTLGSASQAINQASGSLAEGASQQAASLEETSSAMEEIASMTRQSADSSNEANRITKSTADIVHKAGEAMHDMTGAMSEISEKSEKVKNIIKTITDISFQTNLLALNAAVEAARAGEAGKGFAVVADEVRNLSQRSAQAAKDTESLIAGTVESVQRGSDITKTLTESFSGIKNGTKEMARQIDQIATATQEQAQGVDQVNTAMAQMDKITQGNAAAANETATSAGNLDSEMQSLHQDIQALQIIVYGGKEAGAANGNARLMRGRQPAANRMLPEPNRAKVMRPDEIIPIE